MTARWYVAAVAAALLLPAGGARAAVLAGPRGQTCHFNSIEDATAAHGMQVGVAAVGPMTRFDGPAVVRCAIYVNDVLATSLDVRTTGAGPALVAAGAGPIRYAAWASDSVGLCTIVAYDSGVTLWYSPSWTGVPGAGTWHSTPVSPGGCGLAYDDPNETACPWLLAVDAHAGTDLAGVWQDCEPYEPVDPTDPLF
jgi:hypothetical protein